MKNNLSEKDLEQLVKGAKGVIISSNNGFACQGSLLDISVVFSMMVKQLIENGIPKDLIKYAFDLGLEESKKEEKNTDEMKDFLKDFLKDLKDNLDKLLGSDKDE